MKNLLRMGARLALMGLGFCLTFPEYNDEFILSAVGLVIVGYLSSTKNKYKISVTCYSTAVASALIAGLYAESPLLTYALAFGFAIFMHVCLYRKVIPNAFLPTTLPPPAGTHAGWLWIQVLCAVQEVILYSIFYFRTQ